MKGVTLLETIVVLSLAAIVFLFTMTSFMRRSSDAKSLITQSQLLDQLQQAQQIANAANTSVNVCLSNDGKACVTNHATMILLFVDNKLFASTQIKGEGKLNLRSYPYYRDYIAIQPTMVAKSDNGTFWYCSKNNIPQWAMTVSQSGEPHIIATPDKKLMC